MKKKQKELDNAIEEVKQSKYKMRDDDSLKERENMPFLVSYVNDIKLFFYRTRCHHHRN